MKILLVDGGIEGHFEVYRNTIIQNIDAEYVLVLPVDKLDKTNTSDVKTIAVPEFSYKTLSFSNYCKALEKLKNIVDIEKPDIIHFLAGDYLNLFAGYKMGFLRKYQTLATYHHVNITYSRRWYELFMKFSMQRASKILGKIVVHSEYLRSLLIRQGIDNGYVINYPSFLKKNNAEDMKECPLEIKDYRKTCKVILSLGGTRRDKGLDILLQALQKVNESFVLIVAGKEQDISREEICLLNKDYSDKVVLILRYISDAEMRYLIDMCDIVAVPYRKEFNGASGPMIDGVAYGKKIVGPQCGEIGYAISKYHLGSVFEVENVNSLADSLNEMLKSNDGKDSDKADGEMAFEEKIKKPCINTEDVLISQQENIGYVESLNVNRFIEAYQKLYTSK